MRRYKKSYPESASRRFTSSHFDSSSFTEVLRVSDPISRNFFYILFIRDFLRKRISKGQNLSKMIL